MGSIYKINKEIDVILKEYKELGKGIEHVLDRLEKTKEMSQGAESKYENISLSDLFLGVIFIFNTCSNIGILLYLFYMGR